MCYANYINTLPRTKQYPDKDFTIRLKSEKLDVSDNEILIEILQHRKYCMIARIALILSFPNPIILTTKSRMDVI